METHDITLNIHYTAPKEIWQKLGELYKKMPYWYGYIDGIPKWYNFDGKIIDVSVEPGGLQFYAELPQKEWDTWISEFKEKASEIMGYEIGNVEENFKCVVYDTKFKSKKDILSLSLAELETELISIGEKKFRAKQIFNWLHQKKVTSFNDMQNISKDLRTKLNNTFKIYHLEAEKTLKSKIDGTIKYLYRLEDGNHVETVLMNYSYGTSICVSTQVGCKMGCKFCASTIAGFKRNLEPSEILLQIYESERNSGKKISSVVLMGIGEPLDNFDNVLKFLQLVSNPNGNGLSLRHVTISTCGLVPRINELAELKLGLTLAISLHASDNKSRSKTMPINNKYHIEELISACKNYVSKTGRRITFEYALIDGINSSIEDAKKLSNLIKEINCHVNLIPVNKVVERNYSTHMKTVQSFKDSLEKLGINATIRRTLGSDINASCGQLRRNAENI